MQRSPRVFKAIFQPFVPLASRGRWELAWTYPSGLARDEVRVEESRCGRTSQHYCSGVTVSGAQARHTGPYRCRYRHRTRKQTSVYVYVSGKALLPEGPRRTLFVWLRSSSPPPPVTPSRPLMLIVYTFRLNRMWWVLNTDQFQRANYIRTLFVPITHPSR